MIFTRKQSIWGLILMAIMVVLMVIFPPKVVFDYDFESFFPEDDVELTFYNAFREEFENDNDYLLIAIGAENIFQKSFLDRFLSFQERVKEIERVDRVFSLLDVEETVINPFGIQRNKLLDWSDQESLERSIKKIKSSTKWKGNLISEKEKHLLLIVHNEQQISKEDGDMLYEAIKSTIDSFGFERVFTAGKIKAQGEFVKLLEDEFTFFLSISLALIVILIFLIFRSIWAVLTAFLVIALSVLSALALSLYFGKPLDVMSVMQPTILSIISLAALVHFFNHYLNYLRQGFEKNEAIQGAFSDISLAVFLTCLTTSLGFISLYFTSVPSLQLFGLYTGLGVMIVFLVIILTTPSLLYFLPSFEPKINHSLASFWRIWMRKGFLGVIKRQKVILLVFILFSAFSVWTLSQLKVNGYILDNLPRDHELVQEFDFFDQEFRGSKPLEFSIAAGPRAENLMQLEVLEDLEKLEVFIASRFETATILSPLTVLKELNQAFNSGNENAYSLPSRGQLQRMEAYFDQVFSDLPTKILSEKYKSGRISTRMEDIGSLKSGELRKAFENYIENNIDENLLKVKLTGTSHLIDISHESVSQQMMRGLGIAFCIVGLVAGFLFKSWRISLVVLLPNVIPLLWMCAVMWFLGVELKLTTAILFTVAFGIAVDDSIHFMSKLKIELDKGKPWLYALKRTYIDTGKAIILTTVILSSGFAVLILSQFGVTFYAGLLISMALIFALIADLSLLPMVLIYMGRVWENKKINPTQ